MAITGANFVRFTRHGLQAIRAYWSKKLSQYPVGGPPRAFQGLLAGTEIVSKLGDRFEVRRQALKLRFWDERHRHPPGMLLDLTYEGIKSLPGLGIYELRLDDHIGGQSNIRVVFFDPPRDWEPVVGETKPMRIVWVLEVLPKRRNDWTTNDITRFRASRRLIQRRFYGR